MSDPRDLLQKVEALTGPSREVDAEIHVFVTNECVAHPTSSKFIPGARLDWPSYTTSLDAIVALIEQKLPGWDWEVGRASDGGHGQAALRRPNKDELDYLEFAAEPPIAACIVLLKAMLSESLPAGRAAEETK